MMKLIQNRNFILLLALISGIFIGDFADYLKDYSLYILAFMMFVSLSSFSLKEMINFKLIIRPVIISILLNYLLFGIILLSLVRIFYLPDNDIFKGFVFIVLAPPGAVIVPFTLLHGGNLKTSALGVIGASLFLLILFPLSIYMMMGEKLSAGLLELFKIMLITIIAPLMFSQWIQKVKPIQILIKHRGRFIDWSFFLIVYIVIGLNRNTFLNDLQSMLLPTIILSVFLFGFSYLFNWVLKLLKIKYSERISYELLFVVKNNPFSAVISLQIAGKLAAVPSVALSVVLLLYLIFFSLTRQKSK